MAAITICSDFGAPQNKVWHCFHCFPIYFIKWWDQMPWSSFSECWALSQLFHPPLSVSSRGFWVPLHFLPWGWCHLHIWGYWYFSWQSWFQLVCLRQTQKISWNVSFVETGKDGMWPKKDGDRLNWLGGKNNLIFPQNKNVRIK